MSQDYKNKLKELDLPGDTWVTLTNSDHAEVFHYKDDAVNDAVSDTDVVRWFSQLVMRTLSRLNGDTFMMQLLTTSSTRSSSLTRLRSTITSVVAALSLQQSR